MFTLRSKVAALKATTPAQNLWYLNAGFALLFLFAGGLQQFLTAHYASTGHPNLGFHLLMVLYMTVFVVNTWANRLIAKLGTTRSLLLASVCYVICGPAAYFGHIGILYAAFVLMGVGCALIWNAQNAVLIANTEKHNVGASAGVFNMYLVGACVLSIVLFGGLLKWLTFEQVVAIFTAIATLSILVFMQLGEARIIQQPAVRKGLPFKHARTATVSFYSYFFYGIGIAYLPYQASQVNTDPLFISLVSISFFFVQTLLSKAAGRRVDEQGCRRALIEGALVAITGFVLLFTLPTWWTLVLAAALFGAASALLVTITIVLPKLIASPAQQGQTIKVFMYAKYVGIVVAIALSAWLSLDTVAVIAILIGLAHIAVARILPDTPQPEITPPTPTPQNAP